MKMSSLFAKKPFKSKLTTNKSFVSTMRSNDNLKNFAKIETDRDDIRMDLHFCPTLYILPSIKNPQDHFRPAHRFLQVEQI